MTGDAKLTYARCTRNSPGALQQFQPRQILGIDDPDRNAVIINHDQVVDAVALEEIKNFNREFIFMHSHRVQSHQICNETFADLWIELKMPHEIAMGKNTQ
jgi:hypothetical protein